jgi:outer membrane immunogenic protein
MKSFLLATVAVVALSSAAVAADAVAELPVASTYNWTGGYVGGLISYGWGHTRALDDGFPSDKIKYDGALGGVTAGYNWQFGNVVAGVEGDISFGKVKGSGDGGNWGCGSPDSCTFSTDWLATVRGRAGYAFDNVLPYLTAGLAVGRTKGSLGGSCPSDDWCGSDTRVGWAVGAGLEVAFSQNWSVKGEYLYADLGKAHFGTGNGGDGFEAKFKINTVRLGVNYKF